MRQRFRGVRLKNLDRQGTFASGNPRFYHRIGKGARIAMPDLPASDPRFLAAYAQAAAGAPAPATKPASGTIAAGIVAYLASDLYHALAPSTRDLRRRFADDVRKQYGQAKLADLRIKHIKADLAKLSGHPANNRLKAWRHACRYWHDMGMITDDPSNGIRRRPTPKATGATAWTRDDVAAFRAHWPVGSPQRLCMELAYRTAAAIGDVVKLGPRHVSDGWLTYKRGKTEVEASCPWTAPAPAWFEPNDDLHQCLALAPRGLTFILTAAGRPRSGKAVGAWFAAACTAAGLDDRSAHGLRKYRAAQTRENGATEDQRMAYLGHITSWEAQQYSRSADHRRIISGTSFPQTPDPVPQTGS
jgi:integrase